MIDSGFPLRLPPWRAKPDPDLNLNMVLESASWRGLPLRDADEQAWPIGMSRGYVEAIAKATFLNDTNAIRRISDPAAFGRPGFRVRTPMTCLIVPEISLPGIFSDPDLTASMDAAIAALTAQVGSRLADKGVYCALVARELDTLGGTWLPANGLDSTFETYTYTYTDSAGNPFDQTASYPRYSLHVDPSQWTGGDFLFIHLPLLGPRSTFNDFAMNVPMSDIGQWWLLRSAAFPLYDTASNVVGQDHDEEIHTVHVEELRVALDGVFNRGVFRRSRLCVLPVMPTIHGTIGQSEIQGQRDLSLSAVQGLVTSVGGTLAAPLTLDGTDPADMVTAATPQIVAWITDFFNLRG